MNTEELILEEGRERDYCRKYNLCVFCFNKLQDCDYEDSCQRCE